jgi:hypothetical protein
MIELLDPTNETKAVQRPRNPRPASLAGRTIGLLDIAKMRGDLFLDEVARQLRQRGLQVKRYRKPTYAHPAPVALQQQIAMECDVVLEALAD